MNVAFSLFESFLIVQDSNKDISLVAACDRNKDRGRVTRNPSLKTYRDTIQIANRTLHFCILRT